MSIRFIYGNDKRPEHGHPGPVGAFGEGCGRNGEDYGVSPHSPPEPRTLNPEPPCSCRGFTLIELLSVMVIMAFMLSIAVIAFVQIGHAAGIRASALNVQAALGLARQNAITYRARTTFTYSNMNSDSEMLVGVYKITTNGAMVGGLTRLDTGIVFTNPQAGSFVFDLDGSCTGLIADTDITVCERDKPTNVAISSVITLYPLTGRIRINTQ